MSYLNEETRKKYGLNSDGVIDGPNLFDVEKVKKENGLIDPLAPVTPKKKKPKNFAETEIEAELGA